MKQRLGGRVLFGIFIFSVLNLSRATTLTNGSFEFGLSGWSTTGGVNIQGPPSGTAAGTDGTHSANIGILDSTGSTLFQTVSVLPGTNYLLVFDTAANSPSLGRTSVVQVNVENGALVLTSDRITDVSTLPTGGTNGFSSHSLSFLAPAGVSTVTLRFLDQSPNNGAGVDVMIDNVTLLAGQAAQAPAVVGQPQDQTVNSGGVANFNVRASGTGPFAYQWNFNGTNLAGATGSSLTFSNVQPAQAGSYAVLVSNAVGVALSSNAALMVTILPFVGVTNGSFEFGLDGWSTAGFVNIQGSPSGIAAGTDGTHSANIGINDSTGSALSQNISVSPGTNYFLSFDTAANAPSLGRTSAVQVVVSAGLQVLASTFVTNIATLPTGGTNGFTAGSLSFDVPDGTYGVTLKFLDQSPNGGQGVDVMLDNVRLVLGLPGQLPSIVDQPQNQAVNAGGVANFSVGVVGTGPFRYQWSFNGTNLAGATGTSLVLGNIQPAQAGSYAVRVTNAVGATLSSIATLTVVVPPFVGVTNGSFEFGLDGWTTTGSVTVQGPPSGTAAGTDGTRSANVGANDATGSTLVQTFGVLPGTNYLLVFDTAANSPFLGRTNVVQVNVENGAQVLASDRITDVSTLPTGGTNGFSPRSLSFFVPDGVFNVTLRFLDQSPNNGAGVDEMIDKVTVLMGQPAQPAAIAGQPQSQIVNIGGVASFSVAASGSGPFGYQWSFNGTNLAGATGSSLTFANVQPPLAGSYAVLVTNAVGVALSSNATLTVAIPPFPGVTNGSFEFGLDGWSTAGSVGVQGPPSGTAAGTDGTHSANIGVFDLSGATLFQTVSLLPRTYYLLVFDTAANSPLPGRTSVVQVNVENGGQILTSDLITDVSTLPTGGTNGFSSHSLTFFVPTGVSTVTLRFLDQSPNNGQGVDAMVDNVKLLMGQSAQPPAIASQPQNQAVNTGGVANFSVGASGTGPFGYQWSFNGTNLAGATGSSLTLGNVQPAQAGSYSVLVSNAVGTTLSSNATLTVPVVIAFVGVTNGSFEFGLSGWSTTGGVNIQGPPSGTAAGTDGTHSANIGAFDSNGSTLSQPVGVSPGANYLLVFDTAANSPFLGRTSVVQVVVAAGLQVLASTLVTNVATLPTSGTNGFTAGSLSFIPPSGVTNVSLQFLDQSPNGGQGVDAMIDNIRVLPTQFPAIFGQPQNQIVNAGGIANFSVAASGSGPFGYQWSFNGSNLAGATGSSLTLGNVQPTQAGSYAVLVSNIVGAVLSSNAILTVTIPPFGGVTNGSFEFGLSGWTTTGSVTVQGPPSDIAAGTDGTHSANIGAFNTTGSTLLQTISVLPGTNYLLVFDTAANALSLGLTSVVQVIVATGAQVLATDQMTDVSTLPAGGTNGFSHRSLSFSVPNGVFNVSLKFLDQSPNGGQGVDEMIDNVRLLLGQPAQPPVIVGQPQSQAVNAGGVANFSVGASGTGPFGYQWSCNGTNLAGATGSSLMLGNVQPAQAGSYAVLASNVVGTALSSNATLTVAIPPFVGVTNGSFEFGLNGWSTTGGVTVQGPPSDIPEGTDGAHAANIGAFDSTGSTLSQVIGVLPGTNYSLSFDSAANAASAGRTSVVQVSVAAGLQVLASALVTNVTGSWTGGTNGFVPGSLSFSTPSGAYSVTLKFLDQSPNGGQGVDVMIDNVTLAQNPPPGIVGQPQNRAVNAGGVTNFSVTASGPGPFGYQWSFDGTDLAGATGSSLTLSNVQPAQSGIYAVLVSNAGGAILSSNATLTVTILPFVGVTNGSFEFGLSGWGTTGFVNVQGPPSGVSAGTDGTHSANIGANDSTGSTLSQTISAPPGTNYFLSFDSAANSLSLGRTSVVQVVVMAGVQVLASTAITNVATMPTGGANGFTSGSLIFDIPNGTYSVTLKFLVSPESGHGVDPMIDNVTLVLGLPGQPPSIVSQPQNQTVNAGGVANFSVGASGFGPFGYQWRFNGTNLAGATSRFLTLGNVQPQQVGSYAVLVSNAAGTTLSSSATLTVGVLPFVGVTNGSFEFGLSGWTTTASVTVQGPPSGTGAGTDGTHSANIGANDSTGSTLSQSISVLPGIVYSLSFDSAANSPFLGRTSVVQVVVQTVAQVLNSDLLTDVSALVTGGTNGFTPRSLSFLVPDGVYNVTLRFMDQSPNKGQAVDSMVDNVVLLSGQPAQPPTIVGQPQNQTVNAGDVANFSVGASGTGPFAYQWSFNGTNLAGATGSSLTLSNVQPAQAGSYAALASNLVGTALSSNATLTVAILPFVGVTNGSFEFGLSGWITNGSVNAQGPPSGTAAGTDGTHSAKIGTSINTASMISQIVSVLPGTNYLLVLDTAANWPSPGPTSIVQVNVENGPQVLTSDLITDVSTLPTGGTNGFSPRSLSFSVPDGVFNVTLRFRGQAVTNGGQEADAMIDTVRVLLGQPPQPPAIVGQPQNQTVNAGGVANFSVGALGTGPFGYQWSFNGTNLAGATGSSLTLGSVQPALAGNYAVLVANAVGEALSSNATLAVATLPFVGVTNGSFEFGLDGWSATGGVTVQGPPSGTAAGTDGTHSANIGAFDKTGSTLVQVVSVSPGTRYFLSFDSAANAPSLGRTSVVQVAVTAGEQVLASTLVTNVAALPTGGTNGFTAGSLSFNIPGGTYGVALKFLDQSPNGGQGVDAMIDKVSIVSQNQISGDMLPPVLAAQGFQIGFMGVPGRTYTVQRASSVNGPWTNLVPVTVGQNGVGAFLDTNAPSETAFYRTVYP